MHPPSIFSNGSYMIMNLTLDYTPTCSHCPGLSPCFCSLITFLVTATVSAIVSVLTDYYTSHPAKRATSNNIKLDCHDETNLSDS